MLCESCESFRFPAISNTRAAKNTKSAGKMSTTASSSASPTGDSGNVSDTVDSHSRVIVNELLAYVGHYRNRSPRDAVLRVANWFFSPTEIAAAKKCLVDEFGQLVAGTPVVTDRRSTTTRPAHEAELEDIVSTIDCLDTRNNLNNVVFAAVNLSRLPSFGPEETNICSVADKQLQISNTVDQLSHTVGMLCSDPQKISSADICTDVKACLTAIGKVDTSVAAVQSKLNDIGTLSVQLQQKVDSMQCSMQRSTNVTTGGGGAVDRSRNIVFYGVAENRDPDTWRNVIFRGLESAAGRVIEIEDAIRLGRFNNDTRKQRPILVKLKSIWDRRLVLSGAYKLRDTEEFEHIFIKADESPETRKQKTMERLKKKAENRGETVSVTNDGVLVIDNIPVFSMQRGFVNRRVNGNRDNQDG